VRVAVVDRRLRSGINTGTPTISDALIGVEHPVTLPLSVRKGENLLYHSRDPARLLERIQQESYADGRVRRIRIHVGNDRYRVWASETPR
jgi:hypothetical protein